MFESEISPKGYRVLATSTPWTDTLEGLTAPEAAVLGQWSDPRSKTPHGVNLAVALRGDGQPEMGERGFLVYAESFLPHRGHDSEMQVTDIALAVRARLAQAGYETVVWRYEVVPIMAAPAIAVGVWVTQITAVKGAASAVRNAVGEEHFPLIPPAMDPTMSSETIDHNPLLTDEEATYLGLAASRISDDAMDAIAALRGGDQDYTATGLYGLMPRAFREQYEEDPGIVERFALSVLLVAGKLASPEPQSLSCMAEVLALLSIEFLAERMLDFTRIHHTAAATMLNGESDPRAAFRKAHQSFYEEQDQQQSFRAFVASVLGPHKAAMAAMALTDRQARAQGASTLLRMSSLMPDQWWEPFRGHADHPLYSEGLAVPAKIDPI